MADLRYNPRYRLTLFANKKVLMQFENANPNYNIDFSCNILKDGFSNGTARSTLFIYNLSSDKRNLIDTYLFQSLDGALQFQIEFAFNANDQYHLLSYDDVIGAYNEQGEADYKTNFVLKSGESKAVKYYSTASYQPNSKFSDIAKDQCSKMVDGNSVLSYVVSPLVTELFYPYGIAFSGNTYDNVAKLCYESNNTMFVDRGVVYISPDKWTDTTAKNKKDLDFTNGLLEKPHVGQVNFSKKYRKHHSSLAFQFKSLLLPDVKINDVISVLGVEYTIKRINHVIDSREGINYSIIEGYKNGV